MSRIGCGLHAKQLPSVVKDMLDQENYQSQFPDNTPSLWWVKKYLARHPQIARRTPEVLGYQRKNLSKGEREKGTRRKGFTKDKKS